MNGCDGRKAVVRILSSSGNRCRGVFSCDFLTMVSNEMSFSVDNITA